ncbi:FecCD family ABC transporter permease [Rhodococcoides kyotonense]|uniref:Iron complex transport system permease protein n=1 Tax=Rhodococcoides kyotonense TaxID=398843 RepID=A0A239L719_9NOCA|nr:iron ABC transporter permease [Rhodococcus kyotonensis]SNT25479.1 iron complex transport system permease protein [Rhodococcus kyotonensis]
MSTAVTRKPWAAGVRIGPVGVGWKPRALVATVVALVVVLALFVFSITIGAGGLDPAAVVRALAGVGDSAERFVVVELRLPRTLVGAVVGLALGIAGALTQTFARNPLATPDILGVTSGASVGAVAAIVLGGGSYAVGNGLLTLGLPSCAAIGAVAAAAVVYGLGWRGGISSYRIILVGIGVAATLDAVTSYLLVRAQISQAAAASQWLVGSVSSVSWSTVTPLVTVVVIAVPLALATSAALAVGQLGDDVARGVGLGLQWHRLVVIALAVALTAAAVAAAGPVGFVAFVVPQIAVRLAGTSRPPLVLSGLVGAALVLAADTAARTLFPWEVPVGIITIVIGAPYLIWLLVRHRKELS